MKHVIADTEENRLEKRRDFVMSRYAKIWTDRETHRTYLSIYGYCERETNLMFPVDEAYDILARSLNKDSGIDYKKRCEDLETVVADLIKTINTQTALMKPIVFVAEDEDKVAQIKKFLKRTP